MVACAFVEIADAEEVEEEEEDGFVFLLEVVLVVVVVSVRGGFGCGYKICCRAHTALIPLMLTSCV